MKRRNFLSSVGMGSGALLLPSLPVATVSKKTNDAKNTIKKVKKAMLGVQRRSWEQGVAGQALLETGDEDGVIAFASEAELRQSPDGRLAMVDSAEAVTDPASNGEAVLYAFERTGNIAFKAASDAMLAYLMNKAPRTADGIIYHVTYAPEIWSDAMYMCPPFLAVAGQFEEAVKQVDGYRHYLWNREKKLFSHRWDDAKKDFVRRDFWGVGNGWSAAGMTRVVKALPVSMHAERDKIVSYIRQVVDGCIAFQREDGLFNDVVDKPETFVETNLAQMLAYTIYRGVKAGWLENSYIPAADKMRKAAWSKVDKYGFVQGVCGSPNFDRSGTACEGQAFFLMMEVAYNDYRKK